MIRQYSLLIVAAALILLPACHNQQSGRVRQSVATGADKKKEPGKIEFTKEIHNFGTLKEGEIVSFSFQFKNTGGTAFRLVKAETGCGCITVQYDKEEIQPQAVSTAEVILNTNGEWGNLIKTVEIETSYGEKKSLTIGAFVENKNFNMDLNNLK
jgi:hypothetical protein